MEISNRLSYFRDIISCSDDIYYWCYSSDQELLASTCPAETVLNPIFKHSGCLAYACTTDVDEPMILSYTDGFTWAAVQERKENQIYRVHVIGPCLSYGVSPYMMDHVRQTLNSGMTNSSEGYNQRLLSELEKLPVVSIALFSRYAMMLYFTITDKKLPLSYIHYQTNQTLESATAPKYTQDRMNIYRGERMMLNIVREGEIGEVDKVLVPTTMTDIKPYVPERLGQIQIAYTILITLCTRAAIEGGLSPELAYTTGDQYIQRLFQLRTDTECTSLKNEMYRNFVSMVHAVRTSPGTSKVVKSCCDYIELHLEEPLCIEILSSRLGYTKYYLSRTFKHETGVTINAYIKITRIEKAKALLANTDKSILQISEEIGFASRSHFSTAFKKYVGVSPAQYRSEYQSL